MHLDFPLTFCFDTVFTSFNIIYTHIYINYTHIFPKINKKRTVRLYHMELAFYPNAFYNENTTLLGGIG